MTMSAADLPTYAELILPTLKAVEALGGSAQAKEIRQRISDDLPATDEQLAVTYDNRPTVSVLLDRMDWARSYAKLGGALDSPRKGLFLLSTLGKKILTLPDEEAQQRVAELDRRVRGSQPAVKRGKKAGNVGPAEDQAVADDDDESAVGEEWRQVLLRRLHALSPTAFEEFVIYLLKTFGLVLDRVGGTGDEGIDGIGMAPISPVLSSRVAVQAKRWDPSGAAISRDVVALFQRDASAAGAERAVLVTVGRFSAPARKAATVATPTVDLIDGDRLCDLVRQQEIGIRLVPQVDESWFDVFEDY